MDSFLKEKLLELDAIPNPPFNTSAIQNYLKSIVEGLGFALTSNQYYSYIHVSSSPNAPKLVLFCHTDHPAFIFKTSNSGILFGKFNTDQVATNIPFEIEVYNKEGEKVFKEVIVSMKGREFVTSGRHKAKPNYSARFSIKEERFNENTLGLYSADNYLGTYALLHLLVNKDTANSEFDLYFVFNHHEEIFQVGSMKFSMDNVLNITDKDIIINIDTWSDGSDNKLLLQVLEKGCVYSLWSKKKNLAESLAKASALNTNVEFEVGVNTGSGDGRILDHYKLTPNLISIGYSTDMYHNISVKGNIGYAFISIPRFKQLLKWLEKIYSTPVFKKDKQIELMDRNKLKKYHDRKYLDKAIESNLQIFEKYKKAVERGYFFHEKLSEKVNYWLRNKLH